MNLFDKCGSYNLAKMAKAMGVYPYFVPTEESTPTEVRVDGEWKIMVGSNNYLGLTHHPEVLEASRDALYRYGSGVTGSRLLNGTIDLHVELESRLAAFLGKESALLFTTGYQTNLGVLAALLARDDHVFLDRLDHACIVDGVRLSAGTVHRFNHGDLDALQRQLESAARDGARGRLIVVDGVFSMEGTVADLPRLVSIAAEHGAAIMVDDAHGLGVMGPGGAGTAAHFGVEDRVDLITATFSKSLASIGGVAAGTEEVIHYIRHHARALIFSAGMPPASAAGALAALTVMQREPERIARLWENTRRMRAGIEERGFSVGATTTPILPVMIGEQFAAARVWRALFDEGVFTNPVVPPAVPANECRIRISMTSEHTDAQIDAVLVALERAVKRVRAA